MMPGLYLAALLVPTGCMVALDLRFRLVLRRAPRPAVLSLAIGVGFFLLWDLAAIAAGHYGSGRSAALTGIMLAPQLPLEELVFISFLSYTTLVLWGLLSRAQQRWLGPPRGEQTPGPTEETETS